ncbi:MAG: hypothetical protein JWQ40_2720, partial [Segetibacter sp.]|nr:hypothetical protein [Segetibacter sp.]
SIFSVGSSATIPTNSPELNADILDGGIADSNCVEWLTEVSALNDHFKTSNSNQSVKAELYVCGLFQAKRSNMVKQT